MTMAEQATTPEVVKPTPFIERTIGQFYEDIFDGVDVTIAVFELVQKYPTAQVDKLGVTQEQLNAARTRAAKIEAGELKPVTRDEMLTKMADVWAADHNKTKPELVLSTQIASTFLGDQKD